MNPFEEFDLDPLAGPEAITDRLRELAADTADPTARARIREAWQELTLHPLRRLQAALAAHPETREPLGRPAPALPAVSPAERLDPARVTLDDLLVLPSVSAALGGADAPDTPPPLDPDPMLSAGGSSR